MRKDRKEERKKSVKREESSPKIRRWPPTMWPPSKEPYYYAKILGTILPDRSNALTKGCSIVTKRMEDGKILGNVKCDAKGNFLLKWSHRQCEELHGSAIELIAKDGANRIVGQKNTVIPYHGKVRREELVVHIPQENLVHIREDTFVEQLRLTSSAVLPQKLMQLRNLLARFVTPGQSVGVPRWFNRAIRELNEASQLARDVRCGTTRSVPRLKSLLLSPFPETHEPIFLKDLSHRAKPYPQRYKILSSGFVRPMKIFEILFTAFFIQQNEGLTGKNLISYTKTFVNDRVIPLENFFAGALGVDNGIIPDTTFKNWKDLGLPGEPLEEMDILDYTRIKPGFDEDFLDAGITQLKPWEPEFTPEEAMGLLWLDCFYSLIDSASRPDDLPGRSAVAEYVIEQTDIIGSISPSVSCTGQEMIIDIVPNQGMEFGSRSTADYEILLMYANGGSTLYEDHIKLSPTVWRKDLIHVILPPALHTGRIFFAFERISTGGKGGGVRPFFEGKDNPCKQFLRLQGVHLFDFYPRRYKDGEFNFSPPSNDPLDESFVQLGGPSQVEFIQSPVINTFSANGSSDTVVAEGCTPVQVTWQINFGGGRFKIADEVSFPRIKARLLSNGIVVREPLEPAGNVTLSDPEIRQLTLQCEAGIETVAAGGGFSEFQVCGSCEKILVIERYQALHARLNMNRAGTGQTVILTVQRSCVVESPLEIQLSASCPSLISLPSTITIAGGNTEVSQILTVASSGCGDVIITVEAFDHVSDSLSLYVFDTPRITTLTPSQVLGCRTFDIEIYGSCFDPDAAVNRNEAFLKKGSGPEIPLTINSYRADVLICTCTHLLNPDTYEVRVRHNGRTSDQRALFVIAPVPVIELFEASPREIRPCRTQYIDLTWKVQKTSKVVIKADETLLSTQTNNSCEAVSGSWRYNRNVPTTFVLEAEPLGGGTAITRVCYVGEIPYEQMESITFWNNVPDTYLYAWIFPEGGDPYPVSENAFYYGQKCDVQLGNCVYFHYRIVDVSFYVSEGGNHISAKSLDTAKDNRYIRATNLDLWLGRNGKGNKTVVIN